MGKARSLPYGGARLERLTRDKCSSLISSREKFYNIDCWVNVIKLFFFITHTESKQARAFVTGKLFQPGLIFVGQGQEPILLWSKAERACQG